MHEINQWPQGTAVFEDGNRYIFFLVAGFCFWGAGIDKYIFPCVPTTTDIQHITIPQ